MHEFRDGIVVALQRSHRDKLVQIEVFHREEAEDFPLNDEERPEFERYTHLLHSMYQ